MATTIIGYRTWDGGVDDAGDRTYYLKVRIESDDKNDGPATIMSTAGLPVPGSIWAYGNDSDPWAWCRQGIKLEKEKGYQEGDYTQQWDLTFTFSTKPVPPDQGGGYKCQDAKVEDPLLEPAKVSGSFVKYTEEGVRDRFGVPILTSSHERLSGAQNEWDNNRPQIKISINVPILNLGLVAQYVDRVNSVPLWGLDRRCIKLSEATWAKKYHGQCYVYYTWDWTFDIRYEGWDRELTDAGTKVLQGHWNSPDAETDEWILDRIGVDSLGNDIDPDPNNPSHFVLFQDRKGNACPVILNGRGLPYGVDVIDDNGLFLMAKGAAGAHEPGDLGNPDRWTRLTTNPLGEIPKWHASTKYNKGALRQARNPGTAPSGTYYIWLQENVRASNGVPGVSSDWSFIGAVGDLPGKYKGAYDLDLYATYNATDIVTSELKITTGMGIVRVEKYDEADFLYLGIPLDF